MTLDPHHELSRSSVEAIRRLLKPTSVAQVSERDLLRLALGIADEQTRLRCAECLLLSPWHRDRLAKFRRRLSEMVGEGAHGRIFRFARHIVEQATAIGRMVAEGRWQEASSRLMADLPSVQVGWTWSSESERHGEVETIVRSLLRPLMELGERDAFDELLAVGYRAATGLASFDLRQWLLSYEGAHASYRGDSTNARRAWNLRLEECRRRGDLAREADTLLDLAEQAQSDADHAEARAYLLVAEGVVAQIDRPDYVATIFSHRALLALREDRPGEASGFAARSLKALEGTDGADVGLFVRVTAARTLVASGDRHEALRALSEVLVRCVEAGRPVDAASCLSLLSGVLEEEGLVHLAARALSVSVGVARSLGSRRLESTEAQLASFAERHPEMPPYPSGGWAGGTTAIVEELWDFRESPALAR